MLATLWLVGLLASWGAGVRIAGLCLGEDAEKRAKESSAGKTVYMLQLHGGGLLGLIIAWEPLGKAYDLLNGL